MQSATGTAPNLACRHKLARLVSSFRRQLVLKYRSFNPDGLKTSVKFLTRTTITSSVPTGNGFYRRNHAGTSGDLRLERSTIVGGGG